MIDFFHKRVQQTIAYKDFIRSVKIDYTYAESYGNAYIKVSYNVDVLEIFKTLSFNEQEFIFEGNPNYIFTILSAQARLETNGLFLRFIQFKHIYESLVTYVTLQLENGLNPDTPIQVKGVDFWPQVNYAERYLSLAGQNEEKYLSSINFEADIIQWEKLHRLAKQSKKIYRAEKSYFLLSDIMLRDLFGADPIDIRNILIKFQVPIHVKGFKIVDEVRIHIPRLVEALKKMISEDNYIGSNCKSFYTRLIFRFYNEYLPSEKAKIIDQQREIFLKHFIVQEGDIVELIDKRIVMINSVFIERENDLSFEYCIIQNNLQLSIRTRTVNMKNAAYVLKRDEFMHYPDSYVKSLSALSRWMIKRKVKIEFPLFTPDLLAL